jgi:hypothetical protein
MEHLAILKRWCYRGTRAGEIFFADARGELPMRRLVRGIGRVYKGEAPEVSETIHRRDAESAESAESAEKNSGQIQ